ncbi:MFS transporter [Gordonia sp. CPCC 206044]|uniref:MFS transporter n=1 Tax=Gordonia sp. CPCC 206044 TaxID=3140793 RepID=UPI003AF3AECD
MTHHSPLRSTAPRTIAGLDLRSAWLILVACAALSMVVAAMAALNTALTDIAIDIGTTSNEMTWIVDGYTLALAALLLPAGAIGDRFGRRGILLVGLAVFAIASLVTVWISDPTELIIARIVAGAGAALIMPATLSLITAGVPADKRAIGVSIWAAVAGAGAIAGLLLTGVLLEFFSWRSVFVTFAASAALVLILSVTIGTSRDRDPGAFDVAGSATSMLAVTGLVLGLLEAPHRGWADPLVLGCLVGGAVLLVVFCVLERRRTSPLLDITMFANRAFGAGALSVTMQFFASFGTFYLMLQHFQLVFGYSPLQSAIAIGPLIGGVGFFALFGNWVAVRYDSLRFVLGGGIMIAGLGILLLGVIDYETYWGLVWILGICAVGIGLNTAPSTTAIMANTPIDNQGVGSAVNDTARELGAAIGIALAGSIMAAGYSTQIAPVADSAREQLTAAGQQRIAAGDPVSGQALTTQADTVADHIGRSLAEATAVADRIADQAPSLAAQITRGAQEAFIGPMSHAYIVLGSVLIASGLVLLWYAPRRVAAMSLDGGPSGHPDTDTDTDTDDTLPAASDEHAPPG